MILLSYSLVCLLFAWAFVRLGIWGRTTSLLGAFQGAMATVSDKTLSDDQKETAIRKAAISTGKGTFDLVLRIAAVLLIAAIPVLIAALLFKMPLDQFAAFSLRPSVIILTLVFFALAMWLGRAATQLVNPDINYTRLDRMIHKLAFSSRALRETLSDLETQIYGKQIAAQTIDRPVFITALPRAGTTLMLEILSRHPDVATSTYRDMPFPRAPILWGKLSAPFRKSTDKQERSHGDGMMINPDSPEAFEEVFWQQEFPDLFTKTGILLSTVKGTTLASRLGDNMKRLLASRAANGQFKRYVSKNNANISRLPALREAFPDAIFLVPLRDPIDHAISMHRQYLRYSEMHEDDSFVQDYMRDIGHFEFGKLHKPILFDGVEDIMNESAPDQLAYWVRYWICAYDYLRRLTGISFLDMPTFTATPDTATLFDQLGLSTPPEVIIETSEMVHPIKQYDLPGDLSTALVAQAQALFQQLRTDGQIITQL